MGSTPDEHIEELRNLAKASCLDTWPLPAEEMIEWDAADFIEAVVPVLTETAQRDDDLGRRAKALLAGDYPATKRLRTEDDD